MKLWQTFLVMLAALFVSEVTRAVLPSDRHHWDVAVACIVVGVLTQVIMEMKAEHRS